MKYLSALLILLFLLIETGVFTQVSINSDNSPPDPSAGLDVKFSNKGFLMPRMTAAQIGAIGDPADGLQAFNIDSGRVFVYVSLDHVWKELSYGPGTIVPTFYCGDTLVDYRDGKSYPTVLIGTQCWYARNLNIGVKISGVHQTNNNIIEKYCYNDLESNCTVYGGLYQWAELVQYLNGATDTSAWNPVPTGNVIGICPVGWHLPSQSEWQILTDFLGGILVAGGKMKETGTSHWTSPNTGATNSSGFTALPGGCRFDTGFGTFWAINTHGDFWSSSDHYYYSAWAPCLHHNDEGIWVDPDASKHYGMSCRCLHD